MSYSIQQGTDGTLVFRNSDGVADLVVGGPTSPSSSSARGMTMNVAKLALGVGTAGGGVLSWQNPYDYAIIVSKVIVDITTKSTGASTIDIGTTATTATTSSDNLIDGLDSGTAVGTFDSVTDKGTNGKTRQRVAAGKWITGSQASGAVAGLVGFAYVEFHPA